MTFNIKLLDTVTVPKCMQISGHSAFQPEAGAMLAVPFPEARDAAKAESVKLTNAEKAKAASDAADATKESESDGESGSDE